MKIFKASEIAGTKLDVKFTGGHSIRMAMAKEGLGFSVNKTMIPKGGPNTWHYKNHFEACYCISGKGVAKDLDTGQVMFIEPDTMYILNKHERMSFEAFTDVVLISVFNPPLTGFETHDKDGSYEAPSKDRKLIAKEIVSIVNEAKSDYDAIEQVADKIDSLNILSVKID